MVEQSGTQEAPPILQRIAGPVVVAAIVGLGSAGFATWDSTQRNNIALAGLKAEIIELKHFASRGDRCTRRDCDRIEKDIAECQAALEQHRRRPAHAEAHWRINSIERDVRDMKSGNGAQGGH